MELTSKFEEALKNGYIKAYFQPLTRTITGRVCGAEALGIRTLSEGVETEEQLAFLKDIGCEIIQGYYFAKPMCETDFLTYLKTHPAETSSDRAFWNEAGSVNFLSGDPLMTANASSEEKCVQGTVPLALIEYDNGRITYPFVNNAYIGELKKLGYDSIEQVESDVNDEQYAYYDRFIRQIERTIQRGGIQKTDNIIGDVVYTFTTKLIASCKNRHLTASTVHTISSEKTDYLVLKYSQALYATYDLVTEITPVRDSAVQIFSNAGFAKVYGTASLRKGITEFAATEVHPEDRDSYLAFFDLDTLEKRAAGFIQQQIRVRSGDGYKLKNIRISKLVNGKFLYTIQSV